MAWPFTSVLEPNLDTGVGVTVPLTDTLIDPAQAWLLGAHFTNDAGVASITVTVTNSAGNILCKLKIPVGGEQPYEWPFRPALGVRWSASALGCKGHVWGYK